MKGLSIFSWFSYPLPLQKRLELIKNAGFDATSLWWGDEFEDKNHQPEMARRLGLEIDYVHAPAENPNALWLDNINGNSYLNLLLSCIEDCRRHDIPTAVIHVTRLSSRPPVTQLGIDRIKRLVELAEQKHPAWGLQSVRPWVVRLIVLPARVKVSQPRHRRSGRRRTCTAFTMTMKYELTVKQNGPQTLMQKPAA